MPTLLIEEYSDEWIGPRNNATDGQTSTLSNYRNKCSSSVRGGLFKSCIGDLDASVPIADDLYVALINKTNSDVDQDSMSSNAIIPKFQSQDIISKLVIPRHSLEQLVGETSAVHLLNNSVSPSVRSRSHSCIGRTHLDTTNYHRIPSGLSYVEDEPQHLIVMQHGYVMNYNF